MKAFKLERISDSGFEEIKFG
jgi:hypothetical protein